MRIVNGGKKLKRSIYLIYPKKINIAKEGEEPKYLKIVNCWDDMTIVEAISL
jgi:hypothetical protein